MSEPQVEITGRVLGYRVAREDIAEILTTMMQSMGFLKYSLSLSLVSDRKIQKLNRQFLGKDKPTDVLSFPAFKWRLALCVPKKFKKSMVEASLPEPEGMIPHLGDLIVSLPTADKNAMQIGHSLGRELLFLIIHGFLHITGHDHLLKDEELRMRKEQRHWIKFFENKYSIDKINQFCVGR